MYGCSSSYSRCWIIEVSHLKIKIKLQIWDPQYRSSSELIPEAPAAVSLPSHLQKLSDRVSQECSIWHACRESKQCKYCSDSQKADLETQSDSRRSCLLKKMTDCFDFFEIGSLVTQADFKLVIQLRMPGPIASTALGIGLCYPSLPPLAQEETIHLLLFLYSYYLMCIRVCLCVCLYTTCAAGTCGRSESLLNFLEL